MKTQHKGKLLINGSWVDGHAVETLRDRFKGEAYGEMAIASPEQVKEAVDGATIAFQNTKLTPDQRYSILNQAATILAQRSEQFIEMITNETGFPRSDGEGEVRRCIQTLQLSADEARRLVGEMVPMDAAPGLKNRMGYTFLVPRGVVCAITPFNSPLNVVAHKIAPALAGGNVVVLKPSEHAPLTAGMLCEVLIEAGLPATWISLLNGPGDLIGKALLDEQRIAFYTFTGSTRVGREIQRSAGLRGLQLELGSMASTIVAADADMDLAVKKITAASFRKAGQVCTSVQRVLVHRKLYEPFCKAFAAQASTVPFGDPALPDTVVGPMISLEHAERIDSWVAEAVAGGATLLCGGKRHGTVYEPTVLTDVPPTVKLACHENFAPVVNVVPFDDLQEAFDQANATPFGLAVGIFTSNISTAMLAAQSLDFGGIHVNETSSSRVDVMPFGGVKESGYGREGPRYAVREMMEERLMTIAF